MKIKTQILLHFLLPYLFFATLFGLSLYIYKPLLFLQISLGLTLLILGSALLPVLLIFVISTHLAETLTKPLEKLKNDLLALKDEKYSPKLQNSNFAQKSKKDEIQQILGIFEETAYKQVLRQTELKTQILTNEEKIKELEKKLGIEQKASLNVLKEIEKEKIDLKKFQLAVESASDHVLITDSDGIVLYTNPAGETITGFSTQEFLGTKAGKLWGSLMDQQYYKTMWDIIKTQKKVYKGEITNKRKSGEKYIAEINISPIVNQNGEVVFFVSTQRDITQQKEIDKMKTEFISLASHQLRTPLAAVRWGLEAVMDGDYGALNTNQQQALEEAYKSNERMVGLIDEFLNISRIESGKLVFNKQKTDLKPLVEEIVEDLKVYAQEKDQKITLTIDDELPTIETDPKLITHVYTNLITNSVKYSPPRTLINIKVETKQNTIMTEVRDDGYGIPRSDQPKIFEKFYRAQNVKKYEPNGTGLGLYMVKLIIEALGGTVRFESEESKGTTFWFELPIK